MPFHFEFTRESANRWRQLANNAMWRIQMLQDAIRDGSIEPIEMRRRRDAARLAAAEARGVPWSPDDPAWKSFAAKEPAIAAALLPFAKALDEIGPDEAEFAGLAEVQARLDQLKQALGGGKAPAWKGPALPDERYIPSIAQIRAICDAVAELVKWADRNGPPWNDTDLHIAREHVKAIDGNFRRIEEERKGMKPKLPGARGWDIKVDRMLEKIQHTTGRLHSTWQISRPLPLTNISGGIGDYPAPVLEASDRTTLVNARDTLAEEADKAEHETPAVHVPLLEELDAGEPLAGDLAMPAEEVPSLELGVDHRQRPKVRGVSWKKRLNPEQFRALKFLLEAFPEPLLTSELISKCNSGAADKTVRNLRENDLEFWGDAISVPDGERNSGFAIMRK